MTVSADNNRLLPYPRPDLCSASEAGKGCLFFRFGQRQDANRNGILQRTVSGHASQRRRNAGTVFRRGTAAALLFTPFTATYAQKSQNSDFAHVCLGFHLAETASEQQRSRQDSECTFFLALYGKNRYNNGR